MKYYRHASWEMLAGCLVRRETAEGMTTEDAKVARSFLTTDVTDERRIDSQFSPHFLFIRAFRDIRGPFSFWV
jgi:hypothetical protein